MPPVTVVICTYSEERWEQLIRCLGSIEEQTRPPDEVVLVVVPNPQLEAAARAQFPRVTVMANRQARGLSGARNTGVEAAHGDTVVFLDDDAWADPG